MVNVFRVVALAGGVVLLVASLVLAPTAAAGASIGMGALMVGLFLDDGDA